MIFDVICITSKTLLFHRFLSSLELKIVFMILLAIGRREMGWQFDGLVFNNFWEEAVWGVSAFQVLRKIPWLYLKKVFQYRHRDRATIDFNTTAEMFLRPTYFLPFRTSLGLMVTLHIWDKMAEKNGYAKIRWWKNAICWKLFNRWLNGSVLPLEVETMPLPETRENPTT